MTAMTTRRDAVVRAGRDGFGQLLHSEWTKFRTVRGWVIGMLLAGLLIIAVNFIPGGQCGGMQPDGQVSPGGPGCAVTVGPTGQAVTDPASAAETGKRDTPMRSQTASLSIIIPGSSASVTMASRNAASTASVRLPRSPSSVAGISRTTCSSSAPSRGPPRRR